MKKWTWSSGLLDQCCPQTSWTSSHQQPHMARIQEHLQTTTNTTKPTGPAQTQTITPPQPTPKQAGPALPRRHMSNRTSPRLPPPRGHGMDRKDSWTRPREGHTWGCVCPSDTDIRPTHNGDRHSTRTKNLAFLYIQLDRIPTCKLTPEYGVFHSGSCYNNVIGLVMLNG